MGIKKKYLIFFVAIILVSLVVAGVGLKNKSSNLSSKDLSSLKEYTNQTEINPRISPCVKINDFECMAKIYQENLTKKDITIVTNSCSELNLVDNQIVCVGWNNLSKSEIEDKLVEESMKLLENIAKVKQKRDSGKTELTDEIDLVVGGGK